MRRFYPRYGMSPRKMVVRCPILIFPPDTIQTTFLPGACFSAAASACPMFPAEAIHTPSFSRERFIASRAFPAPRTLNEPVGWRFSNLR